MSIFATEFEALQDSILFRSYHQDVGGSCRCGKNPASFRCAGLESCFQGHLCCRSCIVEAHTSLPFHRIEQWNGTHFQATSLQSLGYILHLGHAGELCHNVNHRKTLPRKMVVVHTNGFHKLSVQFCSCYRSPRDAIQLSNAQLFPATIKHPQTAFSFALLDHFHQSTLSSKKSLHDYHDGLVKLTEPVFPQDVPVWRYCCCYKLADKIYQDRSDEMGRVFRVWIHLSTLRRRGQIHGSSVIQLWGDSLAIRCPACPQVHFNVDLETILQALGDEV
jgi:hypothetical protein